MVDYSILLPAGLLSFIAIATFVLRPWLTRAGRVLLLMGAAAGALWLTAQGAGKVSPPFVLSSWPETGLSVPVIAFQNQAIGLWLSMLACVIGVALLLDQLDEPTGTLRPDLLALTLLVVALTILWATAANLVTVMIVWTLLDATALFAFGLGIAPSLILRIVIVGPLATLLLLVAALQFPVHAGPLLVPAPEQVHHVGLWLALAIALRIGMYPFHLNLHIEHLLHRPLALIVPLISGIAGVGLALRLYQVQGASPFPPQLANFVAAGLIPLGYLVWASQHRQQTVSLLIAYISATGVLALMWDLPLIAMATLLSIGLALPLLLVPTPAAPRRKWSWWPQALGWATVAAFPATTGFWTTRTLLHHALLYRHEMPVIALTAGNLFLVAAMLKHLSEPETPKQLTGPSRWVSATFLALPLLILGIHPALPRFLLFYTGGPLWSPDITPLTIAQNVALWTTWILSWAGGYLLWRVRPLPRPRVQEWLDRLSHLLAAQWVRGIANRTLDSLGASLQNVMDLWEGEHVFLWTLLFAFVLIYSVLSQ